MIISTLLAAAVGQQPATEARLMRFPSIHGDKVVFTYASDLWVCDIKDGEARRLTSHPNQEIRPKFSPDGKWIAFTAMYDGPANVYVMPADGGEPKRLTYNQGTDSVIGWTKDGKVAFRSAAESAFGQQTLFTVSPKGGMPVSTALKEINEGSFSPDGRTVALNRNNSHQYNWRMYRGGTQGRIGLFNLDTNAYSELPSSLEQSYFPMWVGDSIYFISDRANNNMNLFRYATGSKKIEQVTKFTDGDIRWPSTDGRSIVWERNGKVQIFNIATGGVEEFVPRVTSDLPAMRERYRAFGSAIGNFGISPSAKRVVVEARGDIFTVPATNGETRNLTNSQNSRESSPSWSPDGETIAFMSDASGENRIHVMPQMGGEAKMLQTPASDVIASFAWSPKGTYITYQTADARLKLIDVASGTITEVFHNGGAQMNYDWSHDEAWIAHTSLKPNLFSGINLYNVAEKKSHEVTSGFFDTGSVAFDLNGKYLYFVSSRSYGVNMNAFEGGSLYQSDVQRVYFVPLSKNTPNPLSQPEDEEPGKSGQGGQDEAPAATGVDIDGFESRVLPLPWGPGSFPFVIGQNNGVLTYINGQLVKYDFNSKQSLPIIGGATGFSFTPSGAKMAYRAGGTIGIADVRPGLQAGQGAVSMNDVGMMWNPRAEYAQMLDEVWRYQRDNFYDPGMVGVDWNKVGAKYKAMLPYVGDRGDLNYLIGQMIGELGTGHAYVSGGEANMAASGTPIGLLGADYEISEGKVRFKKVYKGFNYSEGSQAPLGAPGVNINDGDFLIAIDGKPVTSETHIGQYLVNKIGKIVRLTVSRSASGASSRVETVRPVGSENNIRYETWVEERRALVDKWSGGKIGYMHVPDTSVGGIVNFMKGYYSQSGKEAHIIDERFNGGGWIPTFFIEALMRQYDTAMVPRYGPTIGFPTQSLTGPKAMLINEYAGSGGDMFPWLFKNSKLGPLIGMRTWGGLVGISGGLPLVDGGNVTSPAFGIFDVKTQKWIAENTGVDPDIKVDNDPGVLARGEDIQLKAAVDHLMAEIKAGRGGKPIVNPKFPKAGSGLGGN